MTLRPSSGDCLVQAHWIDYAILLIYACFVVGIGFVLKRRVTTAESFFIAGRQIPAWITGLAFLSANLGALEVMGMAANGAKYGLLTNHFYWVGAIPAMVFVGVFMMPFYYGSKARSVPEYLKLRFDEKTRGLNALTFAGMTVLASGINMFAMAKVFQLLLGWSMDASILVSALVVLSYTLAGGLASSIYNEVLQFFLIVFGFLPLVVLGLIDVGGWNGLVNKLPAGFTHAWSAIGDASANPMGIEWFGLVMGLGFVLSFGYWCTDFLVVQRAMAAENMTAARNTPLIAAVPKMLFPFLVITPGLIALALTLHPAVGAEPLLQKLPDGSWDYNNALPMLMAHYYPTGMLGLGLTALLASFMSGMAGNVTAFNTVWTYDIYQAYLKKDASDAHYLWMGRLTTVVGIAISVGAAYLAMNFNNIMDYLQLLFSFFNAPLFATFLLGMFWRRATGHGAFWGLLAGTLAAMGHYAAIKGGVLHYPSDMAGNFYGAIYAFMACLLGTIGLSLVTRARPEAELVGLVYQLTPRESDHHAPWHQRPALVGSVVLVLTLALNVCFW
ncbi:MAG: sodium:solute symporter family protein [Candidatus Sericytochromatia bacterium]|nr:sodium:solute symporter family protein [Candidatus Sericytochromatia bacterium]